MTLKKIENLSFSSTCPEQRRYVLDKVGDLVRVLTSGWADGQQWGVTFLRLLREAKMTGVGNAPTPRPSEPQQCTTSLSLSSLIHTGGVITLHILLIWKCFSGCKSLNRYQGLFSWWQEAFVGFEQETDRSEWSFGKIILWPCAEGTGGGGG